jgi:hypothetical protein
MSSIVGSTIGLNNYKRHHNWYFIKDTTRIKCKSSFEVIYANWLIRNNIDFLYEPKVFKLKDGGRYIPDFYLIKEDIYVDPKGDQVTENTERQKRNIELFKKYHSLDILHWGDLVDICKLTFTSHSNIRARARRKGISQEDYLNQYQVELYQ